MHVALFTDLHPATFGGAQISVTSQRRALEKLGHRVTVFTPPLTNAPDPDQCLVELKPVPVMARLARALGGYDDFVFVWPSRSNNALVDEAFGTRGPFDIVHAQGDLGVAVAGIEAARRHGVPVVQTKHSRYDAYFEQTTPAPLLLAAIVNRMRKAETAGGDVALTAAEDGKVARGAWRFMVAHAQAADHVISPTQHFADSLIRRGVSRPITVISNGIDDDVVEGAIATEVQSPPDSEPLRLIWCGRLSAEKRVLEAVEAVSLTDDCTLDIYGEGPLEPSVRKAIDSSGLGRRIRLHGPVSHEKCLLAMKSSSAMLFTSYGFDTQGLVLLEAAAMALPTIYCDPALRETVSETGGILTAGPSPTALATSIRTVAGNRAKLREMRAVMLAHRYIPRQSVQTKKILHIYNSLVSDLRA